MTIKVLVVSTNGIISDGITAWIRQTFGAMDLDGLEVSTIAFEGCAPEVIRAVERVGLNVFVLPRRNKDFLAYAKSFRKLLGEVSFDVVHVCCNSAIAAFELGEAKRCGVKMRIAHSRNTMCARRLADKAMRPFFYRFATDFYACGHDAGKWLFGNRPFAVIPNGKMLNGFAFSDVLRCEVRKDLGVADEEMLIGHVGGFNEQKNHKKVIEVFATLKRRSGAYKLCLIGDGYLKDLVVRQAEELGVKDSVFFLGRRDDVPRLLNAMDCMVFPSLYEGFPNVVLEWQLNGLPSVISSAITKECEIAPLVTFVSLQASNARWADKVEASLRFRDRNEASIQAREKARAKGYDIKENAAMLRNLYLKGVERCRQASCLNGAQAL